MSTIDPVTPNVRRFSIRLPRPLWLGLATVVLIVGCGGLRIWALFYWDHQKRFAVQEIELRGGLCVSRQGGPERLRQYIGDEWMAVFDEYFVVQLTGPHVTDTDLVPLSRLREVEIVDLQSTHATNEGVGMLKRLIRLQRLVLAETDVTDAGLEHVTSLPTLEYLVLNKTEVTDAGLEHLKRLGSLKTLGLHGTKVTDAGVAELQRALPGLRIYR